MIDPMACWLLVASCIAAPDAGGGYSPPTADSATAEAAYQRLILAEDWQGRGTAAKELEACGDNALPFLIRGSKHDRGDVQETSYRLLFEMFPDREETAQAVLQGLSDNTLTVQIQCALFAGRQQIDAAEPALRKVYENSSQKMRLAAAKSLAELGNTDVIGVLYDGAGSDVPNERGQANIGLKALTGRDLNDFGEGAFENDGPKISRGPIEAAEVRAQRYHALAEFSRWLKQEWPDLSNVLDAHVKASP